MSWLKRRGESTTRTTARTGFRRVDWIRLHVGGDDSQLSAEAIGVGFRLPVTRSVPLSVARQMIASGTPFVIRHADGGG